MRSERAIMESSTVTNYRCSLECNTIREENQNLVGCNPIPLCLSDSAPSAVNKILNQRDILVTNNTLVIEDFALSKTTLENLYKLLNTRGKTKQNSLNGVCILHTIEAISQLGNYGEVTSVGLLFNLNAINISESFYTNPHDLESSTNKIFLYGNKLQLEQHYYIQLKRKYLLHFQALLPNFNLTCIASTPLLSGVEGVINVLLESTSGSVYILDLLGNTSGHVFIGIKLNNGLSIIDTNLQGVDTFEKFTELLSPSNDSTSIANYIKSLRPSVTKDFRCFFAFSVSHLTNTEKKIDRKSVV